MGLNAAADSGLDDHFAWQYHRHVCKQLKHGHTREKSMPVRSAAQSAAGFVFAFILPTQVYRIDELF
jgi:hypothetical protein